MEFDGPGLVARDDQFKLPVTGRDGPQFLVGDADVHIFDGGSGRIDDAAAQGVGDFLCGKYLTDQQGCKNNKRAAHKL